MSALIVHVFNDAHTDGSDATLVNPSNWNDGHKFTGGANGSIPLRDTSDATYGSNWLASAAGVLTSTGGGTTPTYSNGAAGTVLVGGPSPTWSGSPTLAQAAIGVVSTDGLVLQNTTAATGGVPVQQSPRLRFNGSGWNGSASKTVDFYVEMLPQNTVNVFGALVVGYALNGGAVNSIMTVDADSNVGVKFYGGIALNAGFFSMPTASIWYWISRSVLSSPADGQMNVTKNAQTIGVGFDFTTDAVLKVRTRAQSAYATVDALGYSVGGVAGASKGAGPVTSITVVNGIVTAIT